MPWAFTAASVWHEPMGRRILTPSVASSEGTGPTFLVRHCTDSRAPTSPGDRGIEACYASVPMSRVSGAAERVRVMILAGEIGPGEPVVDERMREQLGVGRGTLREALRRLEGEGMLVSSHSGAMRVVEIDRDVVRETLQARAALEGLGAGLAARRFRDGAAAAGARRTLETLAGAAESAARSETRVAAAMADRNFHRAVDALGANRPAQRALATIWDRLILAEVHRLAGRRANAPHGALLGAIVAGAEIEAADAARRHVLADVT